MCPFESGSGLFHSLSGSFMCSINVSKQRLYKKTPSAQQNMDHTWFNNSGLYVGCFSHIFQYISVIKVPEGSLCKLGHLYVLII